MNLLRILRSYLKLCTFFKIYFYGDTRCQPKKDDSSIAIANYQTKCKHKAELWSFRLQTEIHF